MGTKSGSGPCGGTPLGPVVIRRPVLGPGQSEAGVWVVDQWEARYVCHLLFTPGDLGVRTWGRVSQRQWATLIMYTCTKMLKWLFQKQTPLLFGANTMDWICAKGHQPHVTQEAGHWTHQGQVTTLMACCDILHSPHSFHTCSFCALGAGDQVNTEHNQCRFYRSWTRMLTMYFDQLTTVISKTCSRWWK